MKGQTNNKKNNDFNDNFISQRPDFTAGLFQS